MPAEGYFSCWAPLLTEKEQRTEEEGERDKWRIQEGEGDEGKGGEEGSGGKGRRE